MTENREKTLEITALSKSFGSTKAVDGLSLDIFKGEMFCIVGPDGAGKTTLVRSLCGIFKIDAGEFTVFGMDGIRRRNRIKKRLGYLSQKFSLYGDLTVDENIGFFAKLHNVKNVREKRTSILARMGLDHFGGRLAEKLSGGMKQKLGLACTLIHSPEILFLDEPTTGVDPVSRREFWQILSELKGEGITILVTTPYMDEAERCDRVAFMHRGKILSCDQPRKIKEEFGKTVMEVVCSPIHPVFQHLKGVKEIDSIHLFGDRLHLIFDERNITPEKITDELGRVDCTVIGSRIVSPSLENIFLIMMEKLREL